MGAPRRYDREGVDHDWDMPLERPEVDGCPGGWYQTAWVESVLRYARRSDGEGGRIPNRLLDLCTDELVIEAVERLEVHEDAWRAERQERQIARMRERSRSD